MHTIDYVVIGLYMIAMVAIGLQSRNSSVNFSDYVRMGSKSTWWMAGFSTFMSSFSAITFTGIAGSAYLAGWSVLAIFWGNALMFFIHALFLAPLLRRTRADTPKDAVRLRFGRSVEQFMSYIGTISSFVWGGTFLLSLATFAGVVFNIPLWMLILGVGGVVVFYSVAGGSWSVQITDSLQALILVPVTAAFALLCLHTIGGFSGLFTAIDASGFASDFALAKGPNHEYKTAIPIEVGMFTGLWLLATLLNTIVSAFNLQQCSRYLSLKDEKSAQKAAGLAGFLMLVGSSIWFVPPIVGRLLYADQVEAVTGLGNQADAAYAITAMNILPPGLLGLILVAMLAATMSSMDGFLTGGAAIIVKNIYIPLMEKLGKPYRQGGSLLQLTRWINLSLGLWSICMAFILSYLSGAGGIFGILMTTFALIAAPTSMPLALALICKRIPVWGFYLGVSVGFGASLTIFILQKTGYFIPWHDKIFIMSAATMLPTYGSRMFWRHTHPSFRQHVDTFFRTINTPINVKDEVGTLVDGRLLRTVGCYVLISAFSILALLFWARSVPEQIAITGIAVFLLAIGYLMWNRANAFQRKNQ